MKKMKCLVQSSLVLIVLVSAVACKSSKKNASTNLVEEVKTTDVPVVAVDKSKGTLPDDAANSAVSVVHNEVSGQESNKIQKSSFPFTVSFYSIGEGTDGEMIKKFKEFVENFGKEKNVVVNYDTNPWGREGEVDYCFHLYELDQKHRAEFIEESKKLLGASKLVHVLEDGQCHPKR